MIDNATVEVRFRKSEASNADLVEVLERAAKWFDGRKAAMFRLFSDAGRKLQSRLWLHWHALKLVSQAKHQF